MLGFRVGLSTHAFSSKIHVILYSSSHFFGYVVSSREPALYFPNSVNFRSFRYLRTLSPGYDPFSAHVNMSRFSDCPCSRFPFNFPYFVSFESSCAVKSVVSSVIRVVTCSFSSNVLDRRPDSGTSGSEENSISSDADKLYQTIIANSKSVDNLEEALDQVHPKLTTDLVVDVLHRLHNEGKVAFRFFTWAEHQECYVHELQAYDEMYEILSSKKDDGNQFRLVCDILDYRKRNEGENVPFDVLSTILQKHVKKYLVGLQGYARKVAKEPEITAFNLLLDAFCKCCVVEDSEAMFHWVKDRITPNANTYKILFEGWCKVRNPRRGMQFLGPMIKMGWTPDCDTYNTAIGALCKAGMVMEATELFESMRKNGSTFSSPTSSTYALMIRALAQDDRMEECIKLIGDMKNSGCLPDVYTYQKLIEGMCVAGKIDEAYKFFEEMGSKGYPNDVVTYNCFLEVLCKNKKGHDALRLYGRMLDKGCLPSLETFKMLISMFLEMGNPDGAFDTWNEMDKRGFRPDSPTYCVMIEGLFGCNEKQGACFILKDVIKKGKKLPYQKFDSFLMQLSAIGDLNLIQRLSEHMRSLEKRDKPTGYALKEKSRKSMRRRGK